MDSDNDGAIPEWYPYRRWREGEREDISAGRQALLETEGEREKKVAIPVFRVGRGEGLQYLFCGVGFGMSGSL